MAASQTLGQAQCRMVLDLVVTQRLELTQSRVRKLRANALDGFASLSYQ